MTLTSLLSCSLPTFNAFIPNSVLQTDVNKFIDRILTYNIVFDTCHYYPHIPTKMSEFREFLITADVKVLHEILRRKFELEDKICYMTIIQLHHIYTLKVIKGYEKINTPLFWQNKCINKICIDIYLDIYYQGLSPSESLGTIHHVWRLYPQTELLLKQAFCDRIRKKNYQAYKDLIISDMEYFLSLEKHIIIQLLEWLGINRSHRSHIKESYILIMLHLLQYSIVSTNMQNMEFTINITNKLIYINDYINATIDNGIGVIMHENDILMSAFDTFLTLSDSWDHLFSVPIAALLLQSERLYMKSVLQAILIYYKKIMNYESKKNSIEFLKCYIQYLADVNPETIRSLNCHTRQQYCVVLLSLLHHYIYLGDRNSAKGILNALQNLQISLVKNENSPAQKCYCYMGSKDCEVATDFRGDKTVQGYHGQLYLCCRRVNDDNKSNRSYSINVFRSFVQFKKSLKLNDEDGYKVLLSCKDIRKVDDWFYYFDIDDDDWHDDDSNWFNAKCVYDGHVTKYEKTEREFAFAFENMIGMYGITASVKKVLFYLREAQMLPETQKYVINQLLSMSTLIFRKAKVKYAQLVLDVNKDENASKSPLVDQMTLQLAKVLDLEERYGNDKNRVIYKCYCIVRHAVKKGNVKDIDIEGYTNHFTFLRFMENEEKLEKQTSVTELLVLLLLLLHISSSSGGHYKSAELKKFLSLKCEYDDAILYLLWCSGDVEINPGPTFQKLEKLPNSQKERNWLYDICSVLGKLSVGISNDKLECKLEKWTTNPKDFPGDFSNPRKKSKEHLNKFYRDLLNYCKDIKKVYIPECYQIEIDQFEKDKNLLYKSFTSRQVIAEITQFITNMSVYSGSKELQQSIREMNIDIKFDLVTPSSGTYVNRSEITRDLAVTFCRISKGLKPTKKSDGIWKEPPIGWNTHHEYYSPHNAGKRKEKKPDTILVDNLLRHIQTHNISIPSEYKDIVKAWEDRSIEDLRKFYTIEVNTASIQHSLRYLQQEGLLQMNIDKLKQIGLTVGHEWFDSDSVSPTPAKRKRHTVKNVNQKISSLVSSDGVSPTPAKRKRRSVNNVNQNISSPVSSSSIDDQQQQAQSINPSSLPRKVDRTGSSQGSVASGNSQQSSECSADLEHLVSFKKKSTKRKIQDGNREIEEKYAMPPTTSSTSLTQDSIQQLQGLSGQNSVGTQSFQVINTVDLKELDFMYADKVEDPTTERMSSVEKTEDGEEMTDKQACELPDMSEQEIFSIIDNLYCNSQGGKSNLSDTNTHNIDENGDIENMIDITVFDTCK